MLFKLCDNKHKTIEYISLCIDIKQYNIESQIFTYLLAKFPAKFQRTTYTKDRSYTDRSYSAVSITYYDIFGGIVFRLVEIMSSARKAQIEKERANECASVFNGSFIMNYAYPASYTAATTAYPAATTAWIGQAYTIGAPALPNE